jgi:cyclopropane fatty-acyl-phospholipid synthase-like methyltransferase
MNTFPQSASYSPEVIHERSIGGNVLFSTEALTNNLTLKSGMKVLDLGCGKALSSVFLAKQFGVSVWAIDNYFSSSNNYAFVMENKLDHLVYPLNCDARRLPFPNGFFDCIISVNSYMYFGTDDKYLPYVSRFLKEDGQIGVSDICFTKEISEINEVPVPLKKDFSNYWYQVHSVDWWTQKWNKTDLVNKISGTEVSTMQHADMKQGYIDLLSSNPDEAFVSGLKNDDELITFFVLTAIRNKKPAFLEDRF